MPVGSALVTLYAQGAVADYRYIMSCEEQAKNNQDGGGAFS